MDSSWISRADHYSEYQSVHASYLHDSGDQNLCHVEIHLILLPPIQICFTSEVADALSASWGSTNNRRLDG